MVLHNNKWDKRAKSRYLKKHNLVPVKVDHGPQPKWTGRDSESEHESESESSRDELRDGKESRESHESLDTKSINSPHEKKVLEGADGVKLEDGGLVEFELEPQQNQEDADIIAKHIASFKFEAPKSKNVHYTGKEEDFDEIRESIAHGKLTRDIKRRFGKSSSYKLPEEDEDDFWESTAATTKPKKTETPRSHVVEVNKEHEAFLDNLLG